MKFHKFFDRALASVGTDTLANQTPGKDNCVSHRGSNNVGSPNQRVSAVWLPSADEGATVVPLRLAMFDHNSARWFWTGAAVNASQNQRIVLPLIVPAEGAIDPTRLQNIGGGGIEVALIAATTAGLVSATHTFCIAFDLAAV